MRTYKNTLEEHRVRAAMEKFSPTVEKLTELQRDFAPALVPDLFNGGTRVTKRIDNHAYQAYVPGLGDHVLVALRGHGESFIKIGGQPTRRFPVRPGLISVIPSGHDGVYDATGGEVSNILLSPRRLLECAEQLGAVQRAELICSISACDPRLYSIMDLLSAEAERGKASSRLFIEQLLDLVCMQLLHAHSAGSLPSATRYRGLAPWQVKRITTYMRENLDKDIGLQELADLVNLTRFYFCSAFRSATGYTPHEWLTRLRMDEARRLLVACRSMPIADIALLVGYQTPSAFAARFHRFMGTTPREFRRTT